MFKPLTNEAEGTIKHTIEVNVQENYACTECEGALKEGQAEDGL